MSDDAGHGFALPPPIDRWLTPLSDAQPCGPDLEYDAQCQDLHDATGKPDTQFGPGEPPSWPHVRELAESLFERTRDLRLAAWWGRASLNLDGIAALPATLALLHGLLARFWEQVHPVPDPDDVDGLVRLSVLGGLDKVSGLLGDIREAALSDDRRLEGLRVRDVELASGILAPRSGESVRSSAHIEALLHGAGDVAAALKQQVSSSQASLEQLKALIAERFDPNLVVDLSALSAMLAAIGAVLPATDAATEGEAMSEEVLSDDPLRTPATRPSAGVHSIASRQEAIRAIELVCAYLESSEPTNPAQLFLRRAGRVIDKNFLQLVDELAPDALKEVARIVGVDPGTINAQN